MRPIPWLGILRFQPVTKIEAEINKITTPAVRIDLVIPGYPAAKLGLKNRDLIVAMDGKALEAFASPEMVVMNFQQTYMRKPTGQTVSLKVLSDGASREIKLPLEPMPTLPRQAPRFIHRTLGLVLREKVMLDQHLDKGPTAGVEGMVVEAVGQRSPAEKAGLRQGDVVTTMNDQALRTAQQCKTIVTQAMDKTPPAEIKIIIQRGSSVETLTIRPPSR